MKKKSSYLTATYKIFTLKFKDNQVIIYSLVDDINSLKNFADTGSYTLKDDDYKIVIKGGSFSNNLYIIKLARDDFWFFYTEKNSVYDYQMTAQ